ncbi:hypothetical protein ACN47E_006667 [Coniothyrium glycines]
MDLDHCIKAIIPARPSRYADSERRYPPTAYKEPKALRRLSNPKIAPPPARQNSAIRPSPSTSSVPRASTNDSTTITDSANEHPTLRRSASFSSTLSRNESVKSTVSFTGSVKSTIDAPTISYDHINKFVPVRQSTPEDSLRSWSQNEPSHASRSLRKVHRSASLSSKASSKVRPVSPFTQAAHAAEAAQLDLHVRRVSDTHTSDTALAESTKDPAPNAPLRTIALPKRMNSRVEKQRRQAEQARLADSPTPILAGDDVHCLDIEAAERARLRKEAAGQPLRQGLRKVVGMLNMRTSGAEDAIKTDYEVMMDRVRLEREQIRKEKGISAKGWTWEEWRKVGGSGTGGI